MKRFRVTKLIIFYHYTHVSNTYQKYACKQTTQLPNCIKLRIQNAAYKVIGYTVCIIPTDTYNVQFQKMILHSPWILPADNHIIISFREVTLPLRDERPAFVFNITELAWRPVHYGSPRSQPRRK